jgi:ABC-type lipoprotein release transport system permease subunit
MTLAGAGVIVGVVAASALTRLMRSLLFNVSPLDPWTYAAVPVVLIVAAVLASYLPARQASAVDSIRALKAE